MIPAGLVEPTNISIGNGDGVPVPVPQKRGQI
jgi:hypothetical protein